MHQFDLKDKIAIITGGAQGLGKLLAEQFIRRSLKGSINIIIVDIRDDLQA